MTQVTLNQPVPDFEAAATGDKTLKLSDYAGQFVLIYFYPRDNTAGCSQQAQDFRDTSAQFAALNTVILGVSRDSVRSHDRFKVKYELPFELLADQDEQLCQLFDVIKIKPMYGKQVRGIDRSSFLINPDGVLVKQWRKVKVANHCDELLQAISHFAS
ncbi:MAG: peroxiredoxin [Methylococcales bacterium]|nr:peroxiredoxin [Methylococcales bacterium]